MDLTDIVTAMRKVDANHEPSEANDLLTAAAAEIERLRGRLEIIKRTWELYPVKMMQQAFNDEQS